MSNGSEDLVTENAAAIAGLSLPNRKNNITFNIGACSPGLPLGSFGKITMADPSILVPHPFLAEFNEKMEDEDLLGLIEDVAVRGVVEPIHVNRKNQILDGIHRQIAAIRNGLKLVPVRAFEFADEESEQLHLWLANMNRKTASTKFKWLAYSAYASQLEKGKMGGPRTKGKRVSDPPLTTNVNKLTAKRFGVSPDTVKQARRYAREIEKYPQYGKLEPSVFLEYIPTIIESVKSEALKAEVVGQIQDGKRPRPHAMQSLKEIDRSIQACDDQRKTSKAIKFAIESLFHSDKAPSIEDVNRILFNKHSSTPGQEPTGSGSDKSPDVKDEPAGSSRLEEISRKLTENRDEFSTDLNLMRTNVANLGNFSMAHQVGIPRLMEHDPEIKSFIKWLGAFPEKIALMSKLLLEEGYVSESGAIDDPSNKFPPFLSEVDSAQGGV